MNKRKYTEEERLIRIKQSKKRYMEKNINKVKQSKINYVNNNPDKVKESKRRYAKKLHNQKNFGGMRYLALQRDNWSCVKCNMHQEAHLLVFGMGITVDHIDGQGINSEYKNNDLSNLQTLCLRCHGKKDSERYINNKMRNIKNE